MADELAKAITKIISPALKPHGFQRVRRRDFVRVENGIAQLLYFQVSAHGGREFCVTACLNLIAANEVVTLTPGFRLTRDTDGGDLWLPSATAEEAERAAEVVLGSIRLEALPFFERARSLSDFHALLMKEHWASSHHLSFQRGAVAAAAGLAMAAQEHLAEAIRLYEADGRKWCAAYAEKARALQIALEGGSAPELLRSWERANCKAHAIEVA